MYRSQERAWPPASAHRCQLCDTGVCPRVGQGMAIITQLSVPTPPHSWALSMSKGEAAAVTSKNLPSPQPSRPLKPGDPVPQKVSFEPRARESDVYPATLKLSRGQAPGSEKVQAGRFLSALPLLLMEPEVIQAMGGQFGAGLAWPTTSQLCKVAPLPGLSAPCFPCVCNG